MSALAWVGVCVPAWALLCALVLAVGHGAKILRARDRRRP